MKSLTALELIQHFDELPDDALVPPKVARLIIGRSEWSERRNPTVPRVPLSANRFAYRVGTLRAKVRGEQSA
jgi:hypothetical protein